MSISGYMKASTLNSVFKMAVTGVSLATESGCSTTIQGLRREGNISLDSQHFKLWCTIYVFLLTLGLCTSMPPIAEPNPQNVNVREVYSSSVQTSSEPDESAVAQEASARQLLNSFGLKTMPRGSSDPFSVTPTFMLELYNELAKNGSVEVRGREALMANTVRSFYETGELFPTPTSLIFLSLFQFSIFVSTYISLRVDITNKVRRTYFENHACIVITTIGCRKKTNYLFNRIYVTRAH